MKSFADIIPVLLVSRNSNSSAISSRDGTLWRARFSVFSMSRCNNRLFKNSSLNCLSDTRPVAMGFESLHASLILLNSNGLSFYTLLSANNAFTYPTSNFPFSPSKNPSISLYKFITASSIIFTSFASKGKSMMVAG